MSGIGKKRRHDGGPLWEVQLDSWTRFDPQTQKLIAKAAAAEQSQVNYTSGGEQYTIDLAAMVQVSHCASIRRPIRSVAMLPETSDEDGSCEEDEGESAQTRATDSTRPESRDEDDDEEQDEGEEPEEEEEEDEEEDESDEEAYASARGTERGSRQEGNEVAVLPSFMREEVKRMPSGQPTERVKSLVEHLLSPAVRVKQPADAEQEEALLSEGEIRNLIISNVPGVENFLYREMPGNYALDFMVSAYQKGFKAFRDTPLHSHLLNLYRLIIHRAAGEVASSVRRLKELAEAFMDCQAVQARTVERIGLELQGVSMDFEGLVTSLLGAYKAMAIKFLAMERISQRKVSDDGNPVHYENRLTADLGDVIGLNEDDVRRAHVDEHANARFAVLSSSEKPKVAERCRALFDMDAFLQALVSELNSFNADSPASSLPRQFLDWWIATVPEHKHIIFAEEDCTRLDVEVTLVRVIVEILFLGQSNAPSDEVYRGVRLSALCVAAPAAEES